MKAVAFYNHGGPEVLQYADMPDPIPQKGEAIVNVRYCGLNHLDIWTRIGIAGRTIRLPHMCGCDIVGTVGNSKQLVMVYPGISCGKCSQCRAGRENKCSKFTILGGPGDYDGGYAEKVAVPRANVVPLPKGLKPEAAATLSVSYLTAWNMLQENGAGRGKSVLVYGAASGVGMATIQLAKALGALVITTASTKDKIRFAKDLGADHVIDRTAADIAHEVASIVPGGVDIVIDHTGAATWKTSIACLRVGGRMAVCGTTSGGEATVPIRTFYTKQLTMAGALLGSRAQFSELLRFVARKKIKPVIDSILPLRDAAEGQKRMEGNLHSGKIVLQIVP